MDKLMFDKISAILANSNCVEYQILGMRYHSTYLVLYFFDYYRVFKFYQNGSETLETAKTDFLDYENNENFAGGSEVFKNYHGDFDKLKNLNFVK